MAWSAPLALTMGLRPETPAGTGAGLLLVGAMTNTKILLGVAVIIAAFAIPLVLSQSPPIATVSADNQNQPPASTAALTNPTNPNERREATLQSPATTVNVHLLPTEKNSAPIAPWTTNLLVVDEDERPVPGVEITIWAAKQADSEPLPGRGPGYSGREDNPQLRLTTNGRGRASATINFEVGVARASSKRRGTSRERYLFSEHGEAKLVLEPEILLSGQVFGVSGRPIGGATVHPKTRTSTGRFYSRGQAPLLKPATTNIDGEFRFPVFRGTTYELQASIDDRRSFAMKRRVTDEHPAPVTLTFPGSMTITGTVVGVDGKPVATARVTAWKRLRDDRSFDSRERITATADSEGRYRLDVRGLATYDLLAKADGHATTKLTSIETSTEHPHARVLLAMQEFATIGGRVLHANGDPIPGLKVVATPETDNGSRTGIPSQADLFPRVKPASCKEDGSFRLQVHPGTTWKLSARLDPRNWRMSVNRATIPPGQRDVLITVSDAESAGCTVTGTVRRRDGAPLGGMTIQVVDHDANGKPTTRGKVDAIIEGSNFQCPPLPINKLYGLIVKADSKGVAPAIVGPFSTAGNSRHFDLVLEEWGRLPVRVVEDDGSPARRVFAYLQRTISTGGSFGVVELDAEATCRLGPCVPGDHRLFVSRKGKVLIEQVVNVLSGDNPEHVVLLPAVEGR